MSFISEPQPQLYNNLLSRTEYRRTLCVINTGPSLVRVSLERVDIMRLPSASSVLVFVLSFLLGGIVDEEDPDTRPVPQELHVVTTTDALFGPVGNAQAAVTVISPGSTFASRIPVLLLN